MSDVKPTGAELISKLVAEGSADQIAAFLEAQGVTGDRRRASSCVISEYVRRETGLTTSLGATSGGDYQHYKLYTWASFTEDEQSCHIEDPALVEFVGKFDQGHYPDLIRGGRTND